MFQLSYLGRFALWASVIVVALGSLFYWILSPIPQPTLVIIGSMAIVVTSFVNTLHYSYGIRMFYSNSSVREEYSEKEFRWYFVLGPVLYTFFLVVLAFLLERIGSLWALTLFFLVNAGPLTAYHTVSQDRGLLAIQMHREKIDVYPQIKRWLIPICFFIFSVYTLRFLLFSWMGWGPQAFSTDPFLKAFSGFAVLIVLVLFGFSFAFWRRARLTGLYTSSVASGILAEWIMNRILWPLVFPLSFVFRHQLVYIDLVRSYLKSRTSLLGSTPASPRGEFIGLFFLLVFVAQIFVYFTIPGVFVTFGLENISWVRSEISRAIAIGLLSGATLHHYQIDAVMWKFSNPRLRDHYKMVFQKA